ncbi:hypothetical protein BDP27DRAFT_1242700, partial [Rhodocollybia butyracea]
RYIIMDYVWLQSLQQNAPQCVVLSYDIMCQFKKHLVEHLCSYSHICLHLHMSPEHIRCLIPKFHLKGHLPDCWIFYSFNYNPHCGRTDGEAVEQVCAGSNSIAGSTKKMYP